MRSGGGRKVHTDENQKNPNKDSRSFPRRECQVPVKETVRKKRRKKKRNKKSVPTEKIGPTNVSRKWFGV